MEIKATLPVGKYPDRLYVLGDDRVAVLNRDLRETEELGSELRAKGSIKLIDTLNNSIVEERKLKDSNVYPVWYEENKVLIVAVDYSYMFGGWGVKGKGEFMKITKEGIKYSLIREGGSISIIYRSMTGYIF